MSKAKCLRDSLGFLNGSGDAVETLRHRFPVLGHFHHPPSVQHAVAKQVVKLQAHAVPPPLVYLVVELVPLGGQDGQMLHIPPCQIGAGVVKTKQKKTQINLLWSVFEGDG